MKASRTMSAVVGLLASVFTLGVMATDGSEFGAGPRSITRSPLDKPKDLAKDFGNATRFYTGLDSWAMVPYSSGAAFSRSSTTGGLFCQTTGTDNRFVGQFHMPHGVTMDLVRFWYNDNTPEDMTMTLQESCLPDFAEGLPTNTDLASFTSTGTPSFESDTVSFADRRADNTSCTYRVLVQLGTASGVCASTSLWFYKARVQWMRTAPPAPAVATFPNDVPTSGQFFQEIEALAASGITLGCAAGSFCPDLPVTRRTMAAFLVRALALQPRFFPDPANP
jgi:S-layer homology domain